MFEKHPLVSLCVPTYGRAAFIGETLGSVLVQTVNDFEIIVVDDQSPDNTAEVVRSFSDPRIKLTRNDINLGVPQNLNYAMSLAKGDYVILLEDHDLLEPNYLQETLALMSRYPTIGFVATGLTTIDEQGNPLERYVEHIPEFVPGPKLLRRLLTQTDCPFSVTTVIRRSAIEGIEPLFDSRYWWYADQYLWLRLCATSDFGYVPHSLLKFRIREADHHLTNRHWESCLCLNRIHRDNWYLLHPHSSLESWWDSLKYEKSKLFDIAMWRAGRILRDDCWTEEDNNLTQSYISPLSRVVLRVIGMLPLGLLAKFRDVFKIYNNRRTRIKDGAKGSLN